MPATLPAPAGNPLEQSEHLRAPSVHRTAEKGPPSAIQSLQPPASRPQRAMKGLAHPSLRDTRRGSGLSAVIRMKIGTRRWFRSRPWVGAKRSGWKIEPAGRIPRCAHDTPTRAIGIQKVPWQAGLSLKTRPRRGEAKHRAVLMRLRRRLHKTAGARKIEQHPKLRLFMESVPYASASTSIICANATRRSTT
jgi:hypothetical protein